MPLDHTSNELDPAPGSSAPACLNAPIILLSKGGGGSRLLSTMGAEAGIFMGNSLNVSGDSLDMVAPIYKLVIEKCNSGSPWQQALPIHDLYMGALKMLEQAGYPSLWGFKLPESLLILPELVAAFPGARFVHLIRDPLATSLRRTHLTARLDNQIGQVTLPLAYRYHNLPASQIPDDSPALHMAYTTRHQMSTALDFLGELPANRYLEIHFEEMMRSPGGVSRRFARWLEQNTVRRLLMDIQHALGRVLGKTSKPSALEQAVDPRRASEPTVRYSPEVELEVRKILADLRVRLGYSD